MTEGGERGTRSSDRGAGAARSGRGPLRTKRLYLYRSDLADSPWRRAGDPVPAHAPPAEVQMRWLQASEWEDSPSSLPAPEKLVAERFADGGRCLVMQRRDTGELVYHLWLTASGAWTEWIGARVDAPDGYGLVFDVWAHPAWRGGRLHIPGAAEVVRAVDGLGLTGVVAGVEEHELVWFATMYARAGLGFISPYEVMVWHRLGPLSWHRRARPSEELISACAEAGRRQVQR